jgi:hypothetical protein
LFFGPHLSVWPPEIAFPEILGVAWLRSCIEGRQAEARILWAAALVPPAGKRTALKFRDIRIADVFDVRGDVVPIENSTVGCDHELMLQHGF